MSGAPGFLRAVYRREPGDDLGRFDVSVELSGGRLASGDRLGMCTGIVLRPSSTSEVVTEQALATRLVLRPDAPGRIEGTSQWRIRDLRPLYPASHSNDGPVTAWIERADGTAIDLDVVAAELGGGEPEPPVRPVTSAPIDDGPPHLIPRPVTMTSHGPVRPGMGVHIVNDAAARWPAVETLARRLGVDVAGGAAMLQVDAAIDRGLDVAAYELEIDGPSARLRGGSPPAVTHGMVTLAQLAATGVPDRAHIADRPRHAHRGLSVDLARRWIEPALVERLIDVAAWRKLSRLQLHLTDDEAWRVPVASYPALAEIGGSRGYGLPIGPLCGSGAAAYGRAYTPAEISRWVERAESLAVELVPEIDIPGHSYAALVAVPELRDPDDRSGAISVQGFRDNVLIPGPATTRFLHEAFGSLADLFPASSVLHLGGDEVPAAAWTRSPRAAAYGRGHGIEPGPAMAAALISDAVAAIHAAGRGWAGWQEVAQFRHAVEPAYVVAWTSGAAVAEVVDLGYPVVAAPGDAYYLDMAVDDRWSTPGASWAGSTPMSTTCDFDLGDPRHAGERLIGAQAAIWGEHVASVEVLDELLFPRLDAVAEATWTGDTTGRAADIRRRSGHHPTMVRQASLHIATETPR